MRVAIPHHLERAEVRRRLHAHSHEIADQIPGGMAEVASQWEGEDRLTLRISALGQDLLGAIEIEEGQVVFEIDLPAALSFVRPIVENAIRSQGQKLLT